MIDLILVLAFISYAIFTGFREQKKASQNLEEYFLAGRTLPGWKAGFSMAATQFAADTPLLVTGLIATGGIYKLWRLWIYGVAFLMMGFVFSAQWRRSGILTDAELTEIRYSGKPVLGLRVLKAIYYGTIINCVVMAMVLVAAMRIAEVFLPWHEWLPSGIYHVLFTVVQWLGLTIGESVTGLLTPGVVTTNNLISLLAIIGFTALYSTTGGLRSVVTTDTVQLSLALLGTFIYAVIVVLRIGGLTHLTQKVVEIHGAQSAAEMLSFAPVTGEAIFSFLVIISLQWIFQMNSDGTGYMAQRSMGCRTDNDARGASLIFAWIQIFFRSLLWLIIAIGLLVIYPFNRETMAWEKYVASREITFVSGINELLPPGIRGLMLIGMLAALSSTIDTHLNWGASYWSNDIYQRFICEYWLKRQPTNKELVIVARLSNLLIVTIALIITLNLGSIQTAWRISLLFGAGMGSVLIMRWLWERINLYSELAAIISSLLIAPLLLIVTKAEWIRLAGMAVISTTAAISITFFTPPTKEEVLEKFYHKVQPLGFWSKTATLSGDDPQLPTRRLQKEAKITLLSATTLFLMLLGTGKLLIPSPGQSFFWPILYILIAVSLVPFWWAGAVKI